MLSPTFQRRVIVAILLVALPWTAAGLIMNPSFEDARHPGMYDLITPDDTNAAGPSAAQIWTLFNNNAGTTTSNLVPTTLPAPGAGSLMMHINTTADRNGLVNVFLPVNTGPVQVISSAWVFVNSGVAAIGAGNGGATGFDAFSTTTGQWACRHRTVAPQQTSSSSTPRAKGVPTSSWISSPLQPCRSLRRWHSLDSD